jgi:hypothetical protein
MIGAESPAAEGVAATTEPAVPPAGTAFYSGRTVDLRNDGWGTAKVCSVYADSSTFCFDDEKQADHHSARYAPLARARAAGAAVGRAAQCEGEWLKLYDGPGLTGKVLRFRDISVTQNLSDWGFANRAESFNNFLACNATGYMDPNGGGPQYKYMEGWVNPDCVSYPAVGGCSGEFTGSWKNAMSPFRIHNTQ